MTVCTGCAQQTSVTIRMRVGERELVFRGCGNCDSNTWEVQEGALSLDEVLQLARSSR